MENTDRLCPLLKTQCLKRECAWFEPVMECCWAIRNEVLRERESTVLRQLQQTVLMPINFGEKENDQ